ncbi:MAG: DUF2785 domain-containing protein [Streptosporangiaceae bacterium]
MTDWREVLARDCAVPADTPLAELTDELVTMLAAPEPAVRDDVAYLVLALWTGRGVLDGQLARLGGLLAGRISAGPIYQRSFAAMSLSWVILRDATTAELTDGHILGWLDTFASWWVGETDLRGWDADLGWLHAIAHGADLLRAFGRSPRLAGQELSSMLELAVDRLLAEHGYLWADGEDDRLGYALASVLTRPELSPANATRWLTRIREAIESGAPGPVPAWAANTLRTLGSLYVFADRGVAWYDPQAGAMGPAVALPHAGEVKDAVADTLRLPWRGLG